MASRIFHRKTAKRFRVDKKRYTDRERIDITSETPTHRTVETRTAEYKIKKHRYPKEETGEWETFLNHGGLKLKKNLVTGKIYMYFNDEFASELSLGDCFTFAERVGTKIEAVTQTIQFDGHGHKYIRSTFRSRSRWERKMKREGKM